MVWDSLNRRFWLFQQNIVNLFRAITRRFSLDRFILYERFFFQTMVKPIRNDDAHLNDPVIFPVGPYIRSLMVTSSPPCYRQQCRWKWKCLWEGITFLLQ